jgi:cytochrome c553
MMRGAAPAVFLASLLVPLLSGAQGGVTLEERLAVCAACHGLNGNSTNPRYPVIAGQPALYTILRLKEFQGTVYENPEMSPIARGLSDKEIQALAEYFAAQRPTGTGATLDPRRIGAGKTKAEALRCAQCHLASYAGIDQMPRLAGQIPEYLVAQMRAIQRGIRSDDSGNMRTLLDPLSEEDLEDLAHYFASLR